MPKLFGSGRHQSFGSKPLARKHRHHGLDVKLPLAFAFTAPGPTVLPLLPPPPPRAQADFRAAQDAALRSLETDSAFAADEEQSQGMAIVKTRSVGTVVAAP